jgi:hypothetical protein
MKKMKTGGKLATQNLSVSPSARLPISFARLPTLVWVSRPVSLFFAHLPSGSTLRNPNPHHEDRPATVD